MTEILNRQSRKRLATRQKISDIATGLFMERGFDAVTIDEIAEAADVSRMTIFNHFARKEDLFFDLDQVSREDLVAAIEQKPEDVSPLEALRRFAHWAIEQRRPYAWLFDPRIDRFMATIAASDALKARARAIGDELTETLAGALARSTGRQLPDPEAHLAAAMTVAAWSVALTESHREYLLHRDAERAKAAFLSLADRGARGVLTALAETPYR